ncbi:MAG: 30S ribosomal protein S19e [Methanosarcinales archaeon]|nr:30S ribosomal protein S19e [Methanosarcinales archaeon]
MTTAYDVPADKLIMRSAEKLKDNKMITPPAWAEHVKTGVHKELPPVDCDWWYVRCAAVMRQVYFGGPVGVSRLRSKYGGKERNGTMPPTFAKGSGSTIRKVLQQLEKAGYLKAMKGGRSITSDGQRFLDNTAYEIKQQMPELKLY